MEWIRKSARLSVLEHEGRTFRIERTGNAHIGSGCVQVREVNEMHRDLQRETAEGLAAAKKIVARWITEPQPTEPLSFGGTNLKDLTLGLGTRR